jgi:xanthine dehydrogenase YagS FAD-binding subunit
MRGFDFAAVRTVREALTLAGPDSAYLAGGTTLVDLMKLDVERPDRVLDINDLPMRGIEFGPTGLWIGALERMSDVAANPFVRTRYPVIAQALRQSASGQVRNMASIGGNLLQRTRCGYFRDPGVACNKRDPGSGCPALEGDHRRHAILGTSHSCIATHPSDLAVALVALDASVLLRSADRARKVRLDDFYRLPAGTPHVENVLAPGELVTGVHVPRLEWARNSCYVKVRDRQSYEFALTSAAVALHVRGGVIQDARVAAGGVGTKPWRLPAVERSLAGQPVGQPAFERAAEQATAGAHPLAQNAFKTTLLPRTIVRALLSLTE